MDDVTTTQLAFRLGVAGLVIVGPTLLYLALWRFLLWLRDDELIDQLTARGVVEDPRPAPVDVLASATAGVNEHRCPQCQTQNVAGAPICRHCSRELQ